MFLEEMEEVKFDSNRGRDAFIKEVMEAVDIYITDEEMEEISKLLEVS